MKRQWWQYRENLGAVLYYGIEVGEFSTADDAAYFLEKPWKWDDLYAAWENAQAIQGELADEAKAIL